VVSEVSRGEWWSAFDSNPNRTSGTIRLTMFAGTWQTRKVLADASVLSPVTFRVSKRDIICGQLQDSPYRIRRIERTGNDL